MVRYGVRGDATGFGYDGHRWIGAAGVSPRWCGDDVARNSMRDVQDAPFVPTMYSHLLSVFKSILKPDPKFCSPSPSVRRERRHRARASRLGLPSKPIMDENAPGSRTLAAQYRAQASRANGSYNFGPSTSLSTTAKSRSAREPSPTKVEPCIVARVFGCKAARR